MRFYAFHLMPYSEIPRNKHGEPSAWVRYSNKYYDPEEGTQLYDRYIKELVFADEMGFDGVQVNEHHQNAYGLMPNPNVMAATLVHQIDGQIAVMGNAVPLHEKPQRVAEAIGMLDVLSDGRIICGLVRGIGMEYHNFSLNPTRSRERFNEAHEMLIKCWTEPGPIDWNSKNYKFRNLNVWPQPVQDPHPPIWIPSVGSERTIEWTAQHKYSWCQVYLPEKLIGSNFELFYEKAEESGYEASPYQMGWAVPIYVAESDEKAREEAADALDHIYNIALSSPPEYYFPPGYIPHEARVHLPMEEIPFVGGGPTYDIDDFIDHRLAIVGSPSTVHDVIKEYQKKWKFGNMISIMQFGTLSHEKTMKNIQMFAEEVMPDLHTLADDLHDESKPDPAPQNKGLR